MENSVTLAGSFRNMRSMIKKSNGLFVRVLLLVLLPVLIMNCYTFYVQYSDLKVNYDVIDTVDFTRVFEGDMTAVQTFFDSVTKVFDMAEVKTTAADVVFEIINFVLGAFADAFIIALGISLVQNRKIKTGDTAKLAFKNIAGVMFFNILAYWVLSEAQSLVMSGLMTTAVFLHVRNASMLIASVISLVIEAGLAMLLACWAMLFIYYMMVTSVVGRSRAMLVLGYSREILRKKVFRQMLHISPFIVGSFLIPTLMQGIALLFVQGLVPAIIVAALSIILEVVFNMLIWMYIIPDYFILEAECGIQDKLRDIIEKAMQRRNDVFQGRSRNEKNNSTENENNGVEEKNDVAEDENGGDGQAPANGGRKGQNGEQDVEEK